MREPSTHTIALGNGLDVRVHREWDFAPSLIADWSALASQYGPEGIFLSPGYLREWWLAFGRTGQLAVLTVRRNGETQAILPCWTPARSKGPSIALASLTNSHSSYYDFLARPEDAPALIAALPGILRTVFPGGVTRFDMLGHARATPEQLDGELHRCHFPTASHTQTFNPYVPLRGSSWDAYMATLHPKLQNNLRKGRRRAEKTGALTCEVVESAEKLDEVLTALFDVEFQSWKGKQGTAIRCDPAVESFYRGLARWAAAERSLLLFILRLNDRVLAFDYCLTAGGTVFALKTGYDQEAVARFSAGNLMRSELLKHLFTRTSSCRYDFLGPCFPWKMEWTAQHETRTTLQIFPRSIGGWVEYGCRHGWKRALKRIGYVRKIKAWLDRRHGESEPA